MSSLITIYWTIINLLYCNAEPETGVVPLDENGKPAERVELALKSLPDYEPAKSFSADSSSPFRYWKIRDYAYAYRSKLTTPSIVSWCYIKWQLHLFSLLINPLIEFSVFKIAERFIVAIDEFNNKKPPTPLLITFDPELVREQAAASTRRFEEGT